MADTDKSQKTGFLKSLRGLFGLGEPHTLRESLEEVIEGHEGEAAGLDLGEDQRQMLFNILEYGDLRVDDVMVPRADIVAVESSTPLKELIQMIADASHSRLPVYHTGLDDVRGMVHVKDILACVADQSDDKDQQAKIVTSGLQRPVLFVPPSMKVIDLLARMRATRTHMAIVVDEYGGTDGLVTIEDVVEQIVGDIEDEHDDDGEPDLLRTGPGCYMADARLAVTELEDVIGIDLMPDELDEDIDTLGGLVFTLAGHIPEIGEIFTHETGFRFEVVDADPRRITKVRILGPEAKQHVSEALTQGNQADHILEDESESVK